VNYVFDAMGTLFDLAPLRERLGAAATEAWFERLLHSAATVTIVGEFVPFRELAQTTLGTTCAKLEIEVDQDDVLAQLRQLPPADGAREALGRVDRAFVLTNGGREGGEALVRNAGLEALVERVFGVDEVRVQARSSTVPPRPRRSRGGDARGRPRVGRRRRAARGDGGGLDQPGRAGLALPGRAIRP
jgi:2-haloacid dehalogenase